MSGKIMFVSLEISCLQTAKHHLSQDLIQSVRRHSRKNNGIGPKIIVRAG